VEVVNCVDLLSLLWKWSDAMSVTEYCNSLGTDWPVSLVLPYVDSQEVRSFINNHGLHANFSTIHA
jgi:hypothetical protein